ncbi:hypothetical protein FB45DRAFT_1064689 [Roridomyces roridus]|uniref:Uncharacterized protein n=1 Tax=Roridomyces roridus TaxID=1738132 RepID=A0AAD7B949_9AGAR|nr:hypothetical protein FB45DRAFT_1064689 [Roridomyces roridus]
MPQIQLNSTNSKRIWLITAAEVLLYGVYATLFVFYVKILRKSGAFRNHRFLHSATIFLFVLSTIHLFILLSIAIWETRVGNGWIMTILITDYGYPPLPTPPQEPLVRAAFGIYVTSNIIADSIFVCITQNCTSILRCSGATPFGDFASSLWPFLRSVLSENLREPSAITLFGIPILISLGATIMLMILSAGRIWWLGCRARKIMGYKTRRYYTICAMILESGALYAVGAVLLAILSVKYWFDDLVMCAPITAQLAASRGIAPTIIAVRVGLNKTVESVDSFAIAVQRPRPQLPSMNFHTSTGSINPPAVVYLGPESITEAQNETV